MTVKLLNLCSESSTAVISKVRGFEFSKTVIIVGKLVAGSWNNANFTNTGSRPEHSSRPH